MPEYFAAQGEGGGALLIEGHYSKASCGMPSRIYSIMGAKMSNRKTIKLRRMRGFRPIPSVDNAGPATRSATATAISSNMLRKNIIATALG